MSPPYWKMQTMRPKMKVRVMESVTTRRRGRSSDRNAMAMRATTMTHVSEIMRGKRPKTTSIASNIWTVRELIPISNEGEGIPTRRGWAGAGAGTGACWGAKCSVGKMRRSGRGCGSIGVGGTSAPHSRRPGVVVVVVVVIGCLPPSKSHHDGDGLGIGGGDALYDASRSRIRSTNARFSSPYGFQFGMSSIVVVRLSGLA